MGDRQSRSGKARLQVSLSAAIRVYVLERMQRGEAQLPPKMPMPFFHRRALRASIRLLYRTRARFDHSTVAGASAGVAAADGGAEAGGTGLASGTAAGELGASTAAADAAGGFGATLSAGGMGIASAGLGEAGITGSVCQAS